MGSIISHRIDYNGLGLREASGTYPAKINPVIPPPPPLQAHYPDLGRDTSSVSNALVSQTSFRRENTGGVVKCQLFFQAL